MKIRSGFVSNSSSSSFIVAFKQVPESAEEMQHLLFGDEQFFPHPFKFGDYPDSYLTSEVAGTIFRDMRAGKSLTPEEAIEEIGSGYLGEDFPSLDSYRLKDDPNGQSFDWEKYNEDRTDFARKAFDNFLKENSDAQIHCFTYSDNDGAYGSALEHGGVFERLPHIQISHH